MEQNFKLGDYVYFTDNYDNNHEGEIFDVSSPLEYINGFYSIKTRYGTFVVPIYNIFKTKEDREQARIKRYNKKVQEYCEKLMILQIQSFLCLIIMSRPQKSILIGKREKLLELKQTNLELI